MTIQFWSDKIWLVRVNDEPMISEDLLQLIEDLQRVKPTPHVVIDLGALTQVNSSNLSQLLQVRKAAIDLDVKLRLACPGDPVWAVFLTTGLDKVFEFAPDVPTALALLQMDE